MQMKGTAAYCISMAVAVLLVALGLYEDDTVVTMFSLIAAVLYAVLIYCGRQVPLDPRIPLFSAFIMLIMSLILLYVLNFTGDIYSSYTYDAEGNLEAVFSSEKKIYAHIEGIVTWCISYPLAYVAVAAIAVLFGSRLNRFLVGGFLVFTSEAFTSLMLVALSVFNKDQLGETFFFMDELAYLFTGLVLSLAAAAVIVRRMKGKGFYLSRESLEVCG